MRIRPVLTSATLHAALVCGSALWIGGAFGPRIPEPARIHIVPSAPVVAVDAARDRVLPDEPVDLEEVEPVVEIHEPEIHEPEPDTLFGPDSPPPRPAPSAQARPTSELLARVRPPRVETAAAETPPRPDALPPEPVPSQPAPWVDAVPSGAENAPPAYPVVSIRLRECGIVDVRVAIDAEGRPTDVGLERASRYPRLNRAAVEAVRGWSFEPARRNGLPVASSQVVGFEFTLDGAARRR